MSIFCETSFCVYCVLFLEYNFALLVCNDVCVNMKGSQGMKGCLACTNNHIYTTLLLEYSSYQHHKYDCSNYYIYSNKFPPLHGSIGTHFAKFLIADSAQTEYCSTFHCSSVCSCVTGVTSHISHIYKGINAMLIIWGPIKESSWLSF